MLFQGIARRSIQPSARRAFEFEILVSANTVGITGQLTGSLVDLPGKEDHR
jgi:hypothetical protein